MEADPVVVFTRRAQDITASCTNLKGDGFIIGAMRFVQDAVMLKAATQPTGVADHTKNHGRGDELSGSSALAEGEPQAPGEAFFARCAVVKRRRQQSGHTIHGVEARGGFLPLALCPIPLH